MSAPTDAGPRGRRRPLFLHIGHPKVASSSIQVALAHNIEALRAAGYVVADADLRFPESGPQHGAPVHYIADMCERQEAGLREATARFQQLEAQFGDRAIKTVVSAESLCIPGAEFLGRALQHAFAIHVIYYIRRQDDWLVSAWNEWGCQEGLGLADYCERELTVPQPNFAKVLSRWLPVADSVRVRPLHADALIGGDVVTDLMAAIGADIELQPTRRANTATDLALLEVFGDSPFLFEDIHDNRLRRWLSNRAPADYPIEKATLGRALLERIRKTFAEQNRNLHAEHFPELDHDTIFGPWPDETARLQRHEGQLDPTAALGRVRRVMGLQLQLLQELSQRLERLEQDGLSR